MTLAEVYRNEAILYPASHVSRTLIAIPNIRVGLVTRNVTNDAEKTLRSSWGKGVDLYGLDFIHRIPL